MPDETTKETRAGQRAATQIEISEAEKRADLATQQAGLMRESYELTERAERLRDDKPEKSIELEQQAADRNRKIAGLRVAERRLDHYDQRMVREHRAQEHEAQRQPETSRAALDKRVRQLHAERDDFDLER